MRRVTRWIVGSVLGAALVAACASLPSTEPLGKGPLAEPEPDPASAPERHADAVDARSRADAGRDAQSGPIPTPAVASPDTDDDVDDDTADEDDDETERAERDAGTDAAESDGSSPDTLDFAGDYRGEDETTVRIDGFPSRTEQDPNARTRVEQPADDRIELTLVNSATGDPLCTLEATVSGKRAVVGAGQECFGDGGPMVGTVTQGTAQLEGDQLVLELQLDLEIDLAGETREGDIDYHFEGSR